MDLEKDIINTLRLLSVDMVDTANSGHPGMPLGCAPMMFILWSKIMNFNPNDPTWIHRDRFILSNGHGCALLYTMLYLLKYDYSIDDLKKFRQLHSITPGHPEFNVKFGIEISTGPLGQGIANGVGMAIASKKQGLSNKVFVMCGDGCLMEGVSYEASSLAGHLGLNNLIVLYDDNSITIDGPTSITFTEDVKARFHAQKWNVLEVLDGNNDLQDIEYKLKVATLSEDKPTIICIKTTIGYGSLLAGKSSSHGAPLGEKTANLKEHLGYNKDKTFQISEQVSTYFDSLIMLKKQDYEIRNKDYNQASIKKDNTSAIIEKLSEIKNSEKSYATRESSSIVLKTITALMENIIVGSADLAESNKTMVDINFMTKNNFSGKYIHYGIREHAMCSIANGISTFGILPVVSTFLVFITYCLAPIRMAALSYHRVLYVFTHDSIFLGEDGPTHQPIESLTVLRSIPNLLTIRPCDMNEVVGAYQIALENNGPTAIILSRQKLPNVENSCQVAMKRGAYIVYEPEEINLILIATGSEVSLAVEVAKEMNNIRVVSMPCCELFDIQDFTYKEELFPKHVKKLSLEAGGTNSWYKYVDYVYGINTFGESANIKDLKSHFQFDKSSIMKFIKENIYLNIKLCIFDYDGTLTDGNVLIDANSNFIKQYNTQDGLGLLLLKRYGIKTCIMSGYSNNVSVEVMSKRLKIDYLFQNISDKVETTTQIIREMGINYENIAFMGDDLNDKELLRKVKLSACPENAVPEIKDICLFKSGNVGGDRAVREFIDYIIDNNKKIIF
jgi:transketolase